MRRNLNLLWSRRALHFALILVAAVVARAQAPGTGAITGKITDPSGAVIPSAQVVVVSDETNLQRTISTTAQGVYRAPLLLPGNYSVHVVMAGFKPQAVRGVRVVVTETTTLDIALEVGTADTEIKVSGTPSLAQTETSALGRSTLDTMIVALPLANRNFSQILALSPGVLVELPNAGQLGKNTQNVSANGGKTTANNFQFNGIDANNISENSASGFDPEVGIAVPAPDTISEFKVQTGMYDASYGRGAGANVDIASKSGSNRFHGTAWEFFRNDALNANDYFRQGAGLSRPVLKQNQFGGEIGGPIFKDKTFFLASYQGTLQTNGFAPVALQTSFLPPLTDDRSAAALGTLFAGQSGLFGGEAVAADGSNISPVALAFLNFKFSNGSYAIPTPQSVSEGSGFSSFSIPAHYREDQFSANLDHNFSASNQLSGRYFYARAPQTEAFSPFGASVPGWGLQQTERNHMFVLADTHIFNPHLINVARFGFMRFNGFQRGDEPINAADVGMATPSGLPEIPGIAVLGGFTIGPAGGPFYVENVNTFVWQDTVSWTHGRQSLRFGGEFKKHELSLNSPFVTDGFLFFLSMPDFLLGTDGTTNGSGVSNVFSSTGASGILRKDERYTDFAGFVQDDIKVSPRLTVNAGLRYEFFGPPTEIAGRLPNFDPAIADRSIATGQSTFSGFLLPSNFPGSVPDGFLKTSGTAMWDKDLRDFAPRLGFAYRLRDTPTLVLRGGYGIYYSRLSGQLVQQVVGAPPFSLTQTLSGAPNSPATFANPYVPALPPNSAFPEFLPRTTDSALSIAAIGRNLRSPYTQQYDLNLQYEFAHDFLWQIGYVGSNSTHQTGCIQFNQAGIATPENPINGQTTTTMANLAQRLPYTGLASGRAYICQTSFGANYNSLQTNVVKRFSKGLDFQSSYTWSKNLDSVSGTGGLGSLDLNFLGNDQTRPQDSHGLTNFDRTHRFVLSLVYQPPRLQSGPRAMQYALSHWQLSTTAVAQSGLPITVNDSTAGLIYGNLTGFDRAECTGLNPASSGSVRSRLGGYFNPAAFTDPPVIGDGTGFGNCGVGILRGPSQRGIDLGIQRSFPVTEGSTVQFRGEFFNLTNTPSFGMPVSDRGAGPSFGQIVATASNPRIIQFALKYSF